MLALTAIPNRLYNDPDWRSAYVARVKEILDTVWDEEELLAAVDAMAAIVQQHAVAEAREAAADDTEQVRKFILKRRGEILADLTPNPPDWPEPEGFVPAPRRVAVGNAGSRLRDHVGKQPPRHPAGRGNRPQSGAERVARIARRHDRHSRLLHSG